MAEKTAVDIENDGVDIVANDQSLCPTKTETTELGDEAEQRQQHKS